MTRLITLFVSLVTAVVVIALLARVLPPSGAAILLDIKMPEMDGSEVLRVLKSEHEYLEAIILTGHGSFEAGKKGMELGAYDYIMKPVNLNLLIEKIESAFRTAHDESDT